MYVLPHHRGTGSTLVSLQVKNSLVQGAPVKTEVLVPVGQATSNHNPCAVAAGRICDTKAVALASVDLVQVVTRVHCGTSCMIESIHTLHDVFCMVWKFHM